MDERTRRQALLEAVEELVPSETPADPAPPPRPAGGRERRLLVTVLAGWVAIALLWTLKPAWIFGPADAEPLDAARRDASLRMTLWLERGRVDEYLEEHGRLPGTLEDAGPVEDGVTWVRRGSGYELRASLDGTTLTMTDQVDADSFLGNSLELLRR